MRILRLSVEWPQELGRFEIEPGPGLLGWAGGSSRDRRLFADLLRWAMGFPVWSSPAFRGRPPDSGSGVEPPSGDGGAGWSPLPWSAQALSPTVELELEVEGTRLTHVSRAADEPGAVDGGRLVASMGLPASDLVVAWAGGPADEPDQLLRRGARILADRRGRTILDRALEQIGGEGPVRSIDEGEADASESRAEIEEELAEVEHRLDALSDAPGRLRSLEEELRDLRADAAEAAGDLEVATMDWLRERQDAETHLQTYRDQARELKSRMDELAESGPEVECPFCGRPLGEHAENVSEELRDEWERLVQDGSWWRRRRDQLELKPDRLQELEGTVVRLQADVEECAEALERSRFDLREWDELRTRRDELRGLLDAAPATPLASAVMKAAGALTGEVEDRLVRRAGNILNRFTGGRILGLLREKGSLVLLEDGRPVPGPGQEDRAATTLALHLALVLELVESGTPMESILIEESFRAMEQEARMRAVEVMRSIRARIPQVVLMAGVEVVDAMPERFDEIVEMRRIRGRRGVRLLKGGVGVLRLEAAG